MAFRMPECGVSAGFLFRLFRCRRLSLRAPRTGRFVPEGGIVRSGRRSVGDGAAQVGAPSVHQLLVAMGVGRSGGGLLLFEALQQHMQFLRGALAGPYEVDEILSGVFHVQQHIAVVVQYDVLPEYLHSLFDVRLQQAAIAAVHAGHVQPGTFFGEFVYQRMPGFDGSGCCLG